MNKFVCDRFYKLVFLAILIDSSSTYKQFSVDNDKLCSLVRKRTIKLGLDSHSGLTVNLGQIDEHPLQWDKNLKCNFLVDTTSSTSGIFAVIQNIVFRKNESSNECIDYVQYKRQDGSSSKKYCGRLYYTLGMDPIFAPDVYATDLAPTVNSFVDPKGQLDVIIFISREPLHTYEELALEIIFTSYQYCDFHDKSVEPCSSKYPKCIYKGFFDDGYVNCPYPDCVDEHGCSEKPHQELKRSIGNKVIIGSVSLLGVVFVIFVCFVWLCRKYKKLCWAEEFANTSNVSQQRTIELNEPSAVNVSAVTSAAIATTNHAIDDDKDLPPSYDSLFPNR